MSAFATATTNTTNPRSEFESQRAELVREIALVRIAPLLRFINILIQHAR